jgi:hypothetical protein
MTLSKRQRKVFTVLVAIASLALLATSLLPVFYAF